MFEKKRLFNPTGDDTVFSRKLVGGSTTNLIQLNSVRYKWATNLYQRMLANHWLPEKIDLSTDIGDYKLLTDNEREAYNGILSFLVFLDSLQVNNLPHISEYITAPEVNLALAVQTFFEGVHSASYQYLIESILTSDKRDRVYDYWKVDKILASRVEYIASIYQDFLDTPTEENFFKVLIANYNLEGILFYNGFTFFFALATRHLMGGTADIIKMIVRDELTHVVLFQNIIREYIHQNSIDNYESIIYQMVSDAVEQEINWSNHIIGEKILGMNKQSTILHTKYLANLRIRGLNLGLNPLYQGDIYSTNPYAHLDKIGDTEGKGEVKANFFEQSVTAYNQHTAVKNWDF